MPDEKPKSDKPAQVVEKPKKVEQEVYRRQFVLSADAEVTDCSSAVQQEALNLGLGPNGEATVEKVQKTDDGLRKVVTWVIPVEGRK